MRPAVYASGVTVRIGARCIVDGVDLTVGHGDWLTIVGPNGAGKTTLLRALAGLIPADGRIELSGTMLASMSARERARQIALVPQTPRLPAAMTVAHYVLLGRTAHLARLAREGARDYDAVERALTQLDLLGLADRLDRRIAARPRVDDRFYDARPDIDGPVRRPSHSHGWWQGRHLRSARTSTHQRATEKALPRTSRRDSSQRQPRRRALA
jgi:ABC-type branched-subunit amino acid transport system ATPase component